MKELSLKPTHKSILSYYSQLVKFQELKATNEGSLAPLFAELLKHCARQFEWTLVEQYSIKSKGKTIRADGAFFDKFNLPRGIWEAKDSKDDLEREIKKKFDAGYPHDNILFQAPDRIIIYQDAREVFNEIIKNPQFLIRALKIFFENYQPKEFLEWEKAADDFKDRVPEIGQRLLKQIETERVNNKRFIVAFNDFFDLCRQSINPELSVQAVEEMLIQHLLTERIFRNVFKNADFVNRNIIAREIEKVIDALTSQCFSRDEYLKDLDRFYMAIETTANTIVEYSEKQHFLNTIYEKFFQGFSIKIADTHGIVYTPQSIVDFMVRSVEEILKHEFGKSLSDEGVHILDPFVGTGNFIIRVMREIQRHKLLFKYHDELHCNEVMLLPYYIASMNIEHTYFELTRSYLPFEGICLVDTFELAESQQVSLTDALFSKENTERVKKQKEAPIFVIIGNPPYNAGQVNENDNNKNRKYPVIDKRVSDTYAKDSTATLLRKLSDPYIKAFRLAADRIKDEGIIAFVSNSSFVSDLSFDGMRKHLAEDFDEIYILDLGGNVRKNPKLSGTTHNVFGIQVGVSVNILVRKKKTVKDEARTANIFYATTDELWKKEQKYGFLEKKETYGNINWKKVIPDKTNQWLTEGIEEDFDTFIGIGSKEAKRKTDSKVEFIFKTFSLGVSTNRDSVVYDFCKNKLTKRVSEFQDHYNSEIAKVNSDNKKGNIDDSVSYLEIKWSRNLKRHFKNGDHFYFKKELIRESIYRPYLKQYLCFSDIIVDEPASNAYIFPNSTAEAENLTICVSGPGSFKPFQCLMANRIVDLHLTGDTQSFPFYFYSEDGSSKKENITDWSLNEFRSHYSDNKITKWDIFYYIYALLHHPAYRIKYAANLRRSLPHIPFAPYFFEFAKAGKKLADLHVNYDTQPEYKLEFIENKKADLNWRVEKMKLAKDKTAIIYNDFLTLSDIPVKAFEYRLGNRSALDWIIDQYQVSTDKRSGIVNDPNNSDDPEYIVKLIGKVITVSVETVKIIEKIPDLG